jgi:Lamin Tail Domain
MKSYRFIVLFIIVFFFCNDASAQLFINEGSNKNYSAIADEYGEYPDWIEIYNSGTDTIHLLNYALSDDVNNPTKWTFPNIDILPGEYKVVFCSGKDKKPLASFTYVASANNYSPVVGWNTHNFITPLAWDGVSSLLINVCSYNSHGYTTNSVFNQTNTAYNSTMFTFQDGSPNICDAIYGTRVKTRPNLKLNGIVIGTGTVNNSPYDYPAPYGNWYWAAKNHQN